MTRIDIQRIEQEARALRAAEIRRLNGLFAERLSLYAVLLGSSLLTLIGTLGEAVRPFLTWNPQDATAHRGPALLTRANRSLRALFAWNPQRQRSL